MLLPQIYTIQEIGKGFLAIMPKPRAGEWMEYEFSGLKLLGVTIICSMLETAEAYELELQSESEHCKNNDIEFLSFPIPDRGLPNNIEAFVTLTQYLHHEAQQGAGVVVHCRAGIGRSGLVAATLLLREGFGTDKALEKISLARRVTVPDTKEQVRWLHKNELILKK